jgi:DNA-binding NtrC family response regulator
LDFVIKHLLTIRARHARGLETRGGIMEPKRSMRTLASVERQHILDTLTGCHGNRTHAAKALDISLRGLRGKLHDYWQSGCDCSSPEPNLDDGSLTDVVPVCGTV